MKHQYFSLLFMTLCIAASCNKNEKKMNGRDAEATTEGSYSTTYKAEDGSRAKAIFETNDKSSTLTVVANSKRFVLDESAEVNGSTTYQRSGVTAVVHGDSLTISDASSVIALVKDK